jgi:hypothetical protein
MPAKDIHHTAFVHALERDGWTITHASKEVIVERVK